MGSEKWPNVGKKGRNDGKTSRIEPGLDKCWNLEVFIERKVLFLAFCCPNALRFV